MWYRVKLAHDYRQKTQFEVKWFIALKELQLEALPEGQGKDFVNSWDYYLHVIARTLLTLA